MSLPDLVTTLPQALPHLVPFGNGGGSGGDQSLWGDLIDFGIPPLEKVVRTVAVYLGIAVIIRVVGKRLMSEMNSLDLVVVLLLSNVVQNAIIGDDNSLSGGILGALTLVLFNAGLERLSQMSPVAHRILVGAPTVVVRDGEVDRHALNTLGMTEHELKSALRHQGADHADEVKIATLEPGGVVTVDLKREDQAASYKDLQEAMAQLRAHLDDRLAQRG